MGGPKTLAPVLPRAPAAARRTLGSGSWQKGHVYIEVFLARSATRVRGVCAVVTYVLCLATCLVLLYYSLDLTWLSWRRGDVDIRSFDMPRALLFACMPLSFLLMAIEFARYLLGYDSLYSSEPQGL
jgi:C4-dicarboxylate transporter DctQ subunit